MSFKIKSVTNPITKESLAIGDNVKLSDVYYDRYGIKKRSVSFIGVVKSCRAEPVQTQAGLYIKLYVLWQGAYEGEWYHFDELEKIKVN